MTMINHTNIPTAQLFGGRGYGWNPVKGCNNKGCFLHPANKGKCWAASICSRMAWPFAESEAKCLTTKEMGEYDSLSFPQRNEWRGRKKTHEDPLEAKLRKFEPTWLESLFQKEFPKRRSCILVGYMTDIAFIPREWVQKMIDRIEYDNIARNARDLPLHVFQFLTKDSAVYHEFEWPHNCWLGFTAMNQDGFNEGRNNTIGMGINNSNLDCVNYAYLEPIREKINMSGELHFLDWVIVGGGPNPVNPDWVRSIRNQCQAAGIPFYFKGWGKYIHPSQDIYPDFSICKNKTLKSNYRKKKSKPILDGLPWEQFPEVE